MTQEEKIHQLQVAANITGIHLKYKHLDMLITMYDLIITTDGAATIQDVMLKADEVAERNKDKMAWEE